MPKPDGVADDTKVLDKPPNAVIVGQAKRLHKRGSTIEVRLGVKSATYPWQPLLSPK